MIRLSSTTPLLGRAALELTAHDEALFEIGPDLSAYDPACVAQAHAVWTDRIVDEYRSVVVFAELLEALGNCEAPFEALCSVHSIIGDELRHTAICARAAGWFGDDAAFRVDLAEIGLPPCDDPPAEHALNIIVQELVVGEAESVVMFRALREVSTDPPVRGVLSALLRDEVRHASVGRRLRGVVEELVPLERRARVLSRIAADADASTSELRELYFSHALGGPGRALGASVERRDLVALDPARFAALSSARPVDAVST